MARETIPPGSWGTIRIDSLPNGRFQAIAYYRRHDGTRDRAKASGPSRAAAERAIKKRLAEAVMTEGPVPLSNDVSLDSIAELWIERERLTKRASAQTLHEKVRLYRRHASPKLGLMPIASVTPRTIEEFYDELASRLPPTARNTKSVLNQIFSLAVRREYIDRNPVREIAAMPRPRPDIFAPKSDDLQVLLKSIDEYENRPGRLGPAPSPLLRDVIELLIGTGCRIGEALGLRWVDVDLLSDVPTVTVNGAVKEGKGQPKRWEPTPKTESSRRTLMIDERVAGLLLRRLAAESEGQTFVFHTSTGEPNGPQDVHRALRNVRRRLGLPADFVPHALRRAAATAIADGLGIEAAAGALGHLRSRVTEKHYAKRDLTAPDTREILAKLRSGEP